MSSHGDPSLADVQRLLGRWLCRPKPLRDTEQDDDRLAVEALLSGSATLSPIDQAEIYREQFWLRHRDALAEDFPGLLHLLGEARFDALVADYLAAHPPSSYTLRDLPLALPAFLDGGADAARSLSEIERSMVRLEVAFVHAFDAAELGVVSADKVRSVAADEWPRARLAFQPSLSLVVLDAPVHDLRTAVRRGEAEDEKLALRPVHLAVWRASDLRVHHTELAPVECALLASLLAGQPLEQACRAASDATTAGGPEAEPPDVARWFEGWARRGWVVDVFV